MSSSNVNLYSMINRRRSVKFDESPQVVRYSYHPNASSNGIPGHTPARLSNSTASLNNYDSSLFFNEFFKPSSYSSDYNIAQNRDQTMETENQDDFDANPEVLAPLFRRKEVLNRRKPLRTVFESHDDMDAFHSRQRSSSFDAGRPKIEAEVVEEKPKPRVNLRSNANALRSRRNNPFVRHSVAEIQHRPSGVTRVTIGDYQEKPMYETEEMALHVTECMNLLQTSCDKILGARNLIESDSLIPPNDRDKLMRMVTKSIMQVHSRLENALPPDARTMSDISSTNDTRSGPGTMRSNTNAASSPNISASSVQTPELSREMFTQLMPQFTQLMQQFLQDNMQKRN